MTENLIIFNARLVTPQGFSARKGREMGELQVMDKTTIEVTDGLITYVGPNRGEERDGYYQHYWHYNARGRCVLPGFVDSHTHFIFGGERAEEFGWRLRGDSYMDIMRRGGGIVSTVRDTRACNYIQLRNRAESLLKRMSQMGITTVEGKSGYGLDKDTEGLLLITNDGPLAHRLLSPRKHVDKCYYAKVRGEVTGEDVEQDREQAYSWFRQAAVQGNEYAQFFLDHADAPHRPNALLAATKLLHHMGQIFRDNSVPPAAPAETQMDHRRRQELQEKRIALGHRPDDHEEQQHGGMTMGGM